MGGLFKPNSLCVPEDTASPQDRITLLTLLAGRCTWVDEVALGKNHPNVAIRLNNLAGLLKDTKQLVEAEPLMQRSLGIFQKSLGRDHPFTVTIAKNLDRLLEELN